MTFKRPCRIYITGAAGAGVTTLGRALASRLIVPLVDTDDYYWIASDPPYQKKRPPAERLADMQHILSGHSEWVISGSLDGWGEALSDKATFVVFMDTPTPVRLSRLRAREAARFGDRIMPGGIMHREHLNFLAWAAAYDDGTAEGRSRARHETWLAHCTQPVLRLDGRLATDAHVQIVLR